MMLFMRIIDYHVHSQHSFDGKNTMEEFCQQAITLGVTELCFTEHFSVDPKDVSYDILKTANYSADIESCQRSFQGKLIIRKGLEIGEPHLKPYKRNLQCQIQPMDLDFIIGSIHNINGVKLRLYMQSIDNKYIYQHYFQEIYQMLEQSDIDALGHLDLMKRYAYEPFGNYDFLQYQDLLEMILKRMIEKNIALEINTSGIRDSVKETYPAPRVLEFYKKLGGILLTFGSDAHKCTDLASCYADTMKLLLHLGFKYIFSYKNRQPTAIRIDSTTL